MKLFRALFLTLTTSVAGTAVAQLTNPFTTVQIARDPYVEVMSVFAQMKPGVAPPQQLDVIFYNAQGDVTALLKNVPVSTLPGRWIYATPVSVIDTELYIKIADAASFTVLVNRTTPVAATQRYMEYLVPFDVWATSGPCPNCTLLYLCGCLDPVYGVSPNVDYCGSIQPIQGCGTL